MLALDPRLIRLAPVWALLALAGCSLTSLDEFDLPQCQADSDCQVLNQLEPDLGEMERMTCHRFFCNATTRSCERHTDEICDGFDNDCDEKVDETTEDERLTIAPTGDRVIENLDGARAVLFGVGPDHQPAAAWTLASTANAAQFALFSGAGGMAGGEPLAYRTNASEENLLDLGTLDRRCRVLAGDAVQEASCNFGDLAFDLTDTEGLFVTVNLQGCRTGQLRAGHLLRAESSNPRIIERGPRRRSATYLGIDSGEHAPRCTGRSRTRCGELYEMIAPFTRPPPNSGVLCEEGGMMIRTCDDARLECIDRPGDSTSDKFCTETDAARMERDAARAPLEEMIEAECGATSPSVAVLDARVNWMQQSSYQQSLAAWIGGAQSSCGGTGLPVEAMALYLHQDHRSEDFRWVTGSNDGAPHTLGHTGGAGRPAVRAWDERGYFVGYGAADGGLALHFVPAAPEPPLWRGIEAADAATEPCCTDASCEGAEPPPECSMMCGVGVDTCCPAALTCTAGYRGDLLTDPLAEIANVPVLAAGFGGPVDDVAIAVGAERDGQVELGVTWREGCGTAEELVAFRRVVLDVQTMDVIEEGAAVRLTEGQRRVGPPAVLYRSQGFVEAGLERDGKTATQDTRGGWFVLWRDAPGPMQPGRVLGARLAELDGQPVDERERIEVTQELGAATDASSPFLYEDGDGRVRYAYHDASNDAVVGGILGCAPSR